MKLAEQRSAGLVDANPAAPRRFLSIDVARGVIMILMALDHTSIAWNAGRSMFEVALSPLGSVGYSSLSQQVVREVTHVCAPGFQLLAGMGLAMSVVRRQATVTSEWRISGDIILRAVVLVFCEWVLLHVAMGGSWCLFAVLCCIGSSMVLFSVMRFLPVWLIAVVSLAVLVGAPCYGPERIVEPTAGGYLGNVLTDIALGEQPVAWQVLYPVLPWAGFFGVGWCLGRLYERRPGGRFTWLTAAGLAILAVGVLLRRFGGGFGDRLPGGQAGPLSPEFWVLAKYPPTPAFSMITLGLMVTLLGVLSSIDRAGQPGRGWRIVAVFGQVALFFYVVHFHLYGAYPVLTGTLRGYGLGMTIAVWIAGLVVLWPICAGYARLRRRYRRVLRYF